MIAILTLLAPAMAAPPFEAGPLEPLELKATDVGIVQGKILLLTETQVYVRRASGWEESGIEGGAALAVSPEGAVAICGPGGLRQYTLEETLLSSIPCTDVAPVDGGFWLLDDQGQVHSVPGDGPVAMEQVAALGGGPEQAWVSGNRLHVGGQERLVFPGATDVARLQVANGAEWLLVHPDRSLLGVLSASGLESAWPQPLPAFAVAVGDLGLDGYQDLVLVGPDSWITLRDGRTPPRVVTPPPAPTYTPPPMPADLGRLSRSQRTQPETTKVLGLKVPKFAGLDPDPDYDSMFVGGFGLVIGKPLGSSQASLGFSPGAVGGVERGTRRIRSYFGADSAPLFSWLGQNTGGIHLVMATAGFTIGSDRLRAGPFASLGLLGIGGGVRAVFTPFAGRTGKLTGFEGRLTWFYPNAAHAGLYYVSAFPMGRRGRPVTDRPQPRSFCRRFSVGLGAAGGFSSTAYSWEFVGRDTKYQTSFSPALTIACESGSKSAGWLMGGETAPLFFYRVPTSDQGADRRLSHTGSATLGLFAGTDRIRFGPIVTAGVWTLGAGVRAVVAPFRTPGGVYHGLELRAVALYPSSPAGQAMVIYNLAFDPKSRRNHATEDRFESEESAGDPDASDKRKRRRDR